MDGWLGGWLVVSVWVGRSIAVGGVGGCGTLFLSLTL